MRERGLWRLLITYFFVAAGFFYIPVAECQSYSDGPRGETGDQALGFDGVLARHDGYVKGETPTIPQTSFSCSAQPFNPGLYADVETQCQVYHVCFEDRQESFLCGPGTNFNQRILACDFWYNFDCQDSPSFYNVNADIGKVPNAVITPGQGREPQQPSYPSYPRQPEQPPSGGSYPSRVTVPPPSQKPNYQPRPPVQTPITPDIPDYQPPRPQPPRPQPQPPRIQPQPPRPQPQPLPPRPQPQPQPPRIQPQPQPPRIQPQPQPPRFQPQPRPEPPRIDTKPQYPPQPSVHDNRVNYPPQTPHIQQEDDSGYQFDGYNPQKPASLPPPPPPPRQTPRPVFPPVVSPPRVSRPPLTPNVVRQPEPSISRPRIPEARPDYHPDSHLKGNTDYVPPQQPRIPQPSRPVGTGYPSYPVAQKPISQRPEQPKPVGRPYQPPPAIQQEHIDTDYQPQQPPKEPSRPSTTFVPSPPPQRPIQQEVTNVQPPRQPSRPYVPPPPLRPIQQEITNVKPPPPRPVPQVQVDSDYGRPQPPVAPSIIREQQKPAVVPPSRPQVSGGGRQPSPPQRPKPVFPPPSDHPNANIKGGPGYHQPPPQIPRFEPTRISRPSAPQGVRPKPDVSINAVKPAGEKRPSASASGGYKVPQQQRIKTPSEPPKAIYQPPIQVVDHPRSEIKGTGYENTASQPQQRVKSPSTAVSGVKRPQQPQRPRAPVVVSRPQPPSLPATNIKTTSRIDNQVYERPQPPAPGRVKIPSQSQVQSVSRPSCSGGAGQPGCPQPIDHPNASIKGGSGYNQPYPVNQPNPPSAPSTSYEQKTTSSRQRQPSTGYGRGDGGCSSSYGCGEQQIIHRPSYEPQRQPQASSGVKTKQNTASHQSVFAKQPKPDYGEGSSYTRGPDVYPKPEFGQPNAPYQPVSTPSRSSHRTKQGSSSSPNSITHSDNKPAYQGAPATSVSAGQVRPDYPFRQVPGHQPPHQPQVFPHRENPDHPNESLKGSGAYRPPPPTGFQSSASEIQSQKVAPEPEPEPESTKLLGDIGAE